MSAKFWLVIQIGLDITLVVLFIILIKHFRRSIQPGDSAQALEMTHPVESVLTDARKLAGEFEKQLEEKKAIIGRLNEQLDNRIINLNLLLTRTDSYADPSGNRKNRKQGMYKNTYDLQNEIVALSDKGFSPDKIAQELGVVTGEVNLVLELKKKFHDIQNI